MPGTNGFRVCSTVRDEAALRHAVLFAMSGKDFANTRQSALEAGADEFLLKPIDPKALLALLERTLPRDTVSRPPPSTGTTWLSRPEAFVRFWGVRGSVPTPGPSTVRYGGNTACIEVRADSELIILDSGTGIRLLGDKLAAEFGGEPLQMTLLITHSHWDHVQGFPFFNPLTIRETRFGSWALKAHARGWPASSRSKWRVLIFQSASASCPGTSSSKNCVGWSSQSVPCKCAPLL
jgi:hypothetical protein